MAEARRLTIDQAIDFAQKEVNRGNVSKAIQLYQAVLQYQPNHSVAKDGLKTLQEKLAGNQSVQVTSKNCSQDELNTLINLYQSGQMVKVEKSCRELLHAYPQSLIIYNILGLSLQGQGKLKEALQTYNQAIRLNSKYVEAYNNRGNTLKQLGKLEEAVQSFNQAIQLKPDYIEAYYNQGIAFRQQGELENAVKSFKKAIQLKPDFEQTHYNRGNILQKQIKLKEAIESYDKAIELKSDYVEAYNNRGKTLRDLGRLDESIMSFEQALVLRPNFSEVHSNLLLASHYHPKLSSEAIFKKHIAWGESNVVQNKINESYKNDKTPERRLKVGYISPDFRTHSVAYFIEPILAHHDETFEIYCYSAVNRPDETTKRIERLVTHWVSIIGKSDEEVATRIRDDRIDILVDLAGHTAKNRLLLFAHKAAPIQVTYLGYPNTTGLPTMDYRLTDDYADPSGKTEKLHTEKLIRLSSTAWCYRPPKKIPEVKEYPAKVKGIVTFGSFNASYKLNDKVYELWAKILSRVKDSRLLLKSTNFADEGLKTQITEKFLKQGIERDRIILQGKVASHKAHMGYYHKIDIALDSFPYHGTTTTCEALYMGVPVVSLEGEDHRSRVGVSLLNQVKLQRLIAKTEEEYIEIACSLASDLEALGKLRKSLRPCMEKSPLMDETKFTHGLEKAYREMWQKWCN